MFNRMADIYESETRSSIKRFTTLFEPLIILTMGILVGTMILSMLIAYHEHQRSCRLMNSESELIRSHD